MLLRTLAVMTAVLAPALAAAQEARAPLDACALLREADALALLPGTKQLTQAPSSARADDRESSACVYADATNPGRTVALSVQRFPATVPNEVGLALFSDYELEPVDGVGNGALWKPSTGTLIMVVDPDFITLTVTRTDPPATMTEVRGIMKKVYARR